MDTGDVAEDVSRRADEFAAEDEVKALLRHGGLRSAGFARQSMRGRLAPQGAMAGGTRTHPAVQNANRGLHKSTLIMHVCLVDVTPLGAVSGFTRNVAALVPSAVAPGNEGALQVGMLAQRERAMRPAIGLCPDYGAGSLPDRPAPDLADIQYS